MSCFILGDPSSEPKDPSLKWDEQLLEDLEDKSYWLKVCPHLSIGEGNCDDEKTEKEFMNEDEFDFKGKKQEFVENGFFHLEKEDLKVDEKIIDDLAKGVVLLMQHGWPASFIFIYDQAWMVVKKAKHKLELCTGGSKFIGDMYAWYVNPLKGQRGWGPHRDRMGSGPNSFRSEDKTPMLSTTWFALTNASPNNSCLYVVPASADPYYWKQDEPDVDPLKAIFQENPEAYQDIRALPCGKGNAWHFSHKIIHWGSHVEKCSSMREINPRIAMSWVIGDSKFEQPAFAQSHLPFPDIALRVGFVAGQLIAYGGQTGLRRGFKTLCMRLFKRQADYFSEFYRDKVEYIYYMRPAPPKEVHLKERTKMKKEIDIDKLEFASEKDDAKLDGIKGLFPESDSSSDEEED